MSEPTYTLRVTLKLDENRQNTVVAECATRDDIGAMAENCTVLLDFWAAELDKVDDEV